MNIFVASGRIGKDAETKYTSGGIAITTFSLAVDTGFGDKKKTMWLRCKVFKRENLGQHLTKGKPIMVRGELTINEWEKDGQKHSMPEVICNEVEFQQGQARGQDSAQSGGNSAQSRGNFGRSSSGGDQDTGPAFPSEASGLDDVPF